ncbi:hypothetical protein CK203_062918 [Vitis vinifera]|uniref:Uncharacterized protein n=1 Tax=Vitis vinifera TaxID=29760 RepID=A0A438FSU1_VITVI|nr:hypothetical protein CK203_062918 [Vitis vinifera]
MGLKLKGVVAEVVGPKASTKRWVVDEACPMPNGPTNRDGASLDKPTSQAIFRGPQEKAYLLDCIIAKSGSFTEAEPFVSWEIEDLRKQQAKTSLSAIDRALVEEAMRYGSILKSRGKRVYESPHLIPYSFDRVPGGSIMIALGFRGEFTSVSNKVRGAEWGSNMSEPQDIKSEKEDKWGESSLAKFSHFLGDKNSTNVGGCGEKLRFRNVEDGVVWVFTGVYVLSPKRKGNACGKSLGPLEEFGKILGA